jgi:alpha-tubulin suppressor-like RCC1 family protein
VIQLRRTLPAVLALAACHEDVLLIAEPDAAPAACTACAGGECSPVPDGTLCASGVCRAGDCVPTSCPEQSRWTAVAAGEAHSCAVSWTGRLWCWGRNSEGQLGAGDTEARAEPAEVAGDWVDVAAGSKHACALARDGTGACWGKNADGQVGSGRLTPAEPAPVPVGSLPVLRSVTAGQDHACAVTVEGALWCWGRNEEHQLGAADPLRSPDPLRVEDGVQRAWRQVSAGGRHTCGTDLDGRLWCWGHGAEGQLGAGDTTDRVQPAEVAAGTLWLEVRAGASHTCAIDGSDRLFCWGSARDGEVGLGDGAAERVLEPAAVDSPLRFAQVALGDHFTCAIAQDRSLWCWGRNDAGQLGTGDLALRRAPARVGGAGDWTALAAGRRHVCAIRASGGLYCWGSNSDGQLTLGDLADVEEPTEVCGGDGVD